MFDSEFYPTPKNVINQMGIDCVNKIVLEPSAGKGDIVDYLISNRVKEVLTCEKNKDLAEIIKNKSVFLKYDFFDVTPSMVSHIDVIVMNPPFSNANKHIVHAYQIAPEGCEIIALCNYETVSGQQNRYSELSKLISNYGVSENLGDCFLKAERKTGVEVGLVKLYKPVVSENASFDGFFMDEEEECQFSENGIVPFNEVRAMVQRYVGSMKCYDRLEAVKQELIYTTKAIGITDYSLSIGHDNTISTKEQFSKKLQKISWDHIFNKLNMAKYVTSGVMKDINLFVEKQSNIPFTEKNIYRMFEIIIGTQDQTFAKSLEECIDSFTKYTHENRYGVEGWKTNIGYMLNKKFIVNNIVKDHWYNNGKLELSYGQTRDRIEDLTKVLCRLTGENYDTLKKIRTLFEEGVDRGVWYDYNFFKIKCFKKGTMHLVFKEKKHWYTLNKAYGELKGFSLPEKFAA